MEAVARQRERKQNVTAVPRKHIGDSSIGNIETDVFRRDLVDEMITYTNEIYAKTGEQGGSASFPHSPADPQCVENSGPLVNPEHRIDFLCNLKSHSKTLGPSVYRMVECQPHPAWVFLTCTILFGCDLTDRTTSKLYQAPSCELFSIIKLTSLAIRGCGDGLVDQMFAPKNKQQNLDPQNQSKNQTVFQIGQK
ncbi:hypothetical protein STEG23_006203 [Scotinomys teguina]